ncbi:MAG TPA: hypothetical protein VM491_19265 [Burkholderiaceae bacterium]|nr:hypothetical protein [Burkholderiaceae bacterium]
MGTPRPGSEPAPPAAATPQRDREWFVPGFGPPRFRVFVGLLFLPYTAIVLAFTVIGAMLAPIVHWDRAAALLLIYLLALGIGAHALDAIGSANAAQRPWGDVFSRRQLWALAAGSLAAAYALGAYYMIVHAPLLWPIAIAEGFFVLAYNLEWFRGRFHTDGWFAFSWGALPVLAGYVLQTNAISLAAVVVAGAAALLALVEINASRPYKQLRRSEDPAAAPLVARLEAVLKCISGGVVLLAVGLVAFRLA